MEANELRIGNLVFDDHSGRMIVSAINPYDGMYNHESGVYLCKNNNLPSGYYFLKDIRPIELTEDWLIMFGFENIGSVYKIGELNALNNRDLELVLCTEDNIISYNDYLHPILYVHQLQNLYFAITGKELITKL